jgi:pimeloyl-ACP methyl ester carboxylesterase
MFAQQTPFYSPRLLAALRDDFDLTDCVRAFPGAIDAIYGDRGRINDPQRMDALCLPQDIRERMKIHFVAGACHLPMIENPDGLCAALKAVLAAN